MFTNIKENNMFLAMNRFKITPGFEAGFEKIWRERGFTSLFGTGFQEVFFVKRPRYR